VRLTILLVAIFLTISIHSQFEGAYRRAGLLQFSVSTFFICGVI